MTDPLARQDILDDLRDAYEERIAICIVDGGLSEAEARAVAMADLARSVGVDIAKEDE